MGFTFDDTDRKEIASRLIQMQMLVTRNSHNKERIFPYLGGEEVNESPTHEHHRYVINFENFPLRREELSKRWLEADECERQAWLSKGVVPSDYPNPVAADWHDLLQIVFNNVKPEREKLGDSAADRPHKLFWWRYANARPELTTTAAKLSRVIVCSRHQQHWGVSFVPTGAVFSDALVVFAMESNAGFGLIQCRLHEVWTRFFASSLEDRLRYTPSDCFETFPFPAGFETNAALEAAGREYYEFRAALMQDLWLGLTEIYNHFHSPDDEALARLEALYRKRAATPDWRTAESVPADRSPLTFYATPAAALAAVQRLRTLHAAMDTSVLTAYGWTDLLPKCTCEFLLDYEDEESESGEESSGRKKKKPWRYRWPDEVRDEVLARLLKENAKRAEQERIHGLGDSGNGGSSSKKPGRPKKPQPSNDAPTLDL
jgi:hypothetical protein